MVGRVLGGQGPVRGVRGGQGAQGGKGGARGARGRLRQIGSPYNKDPNEAPLIPESPCPCHVSI